MNYIANRKLLSIVLRHKSGCKKVTSYVAPADMGFTLIGAYSRAGVDTGYDITPVSFTIYIVKAKPASI